MFLADFHGCEFRMTLTLIVNNDVYPYHSRAERGETSDVFIMIDFIPVPLLTLKKIVTVQNDVSDANSFVTKTDKFIIISLLFSCFPVTRSRPSLVR